MNVREIEERTANGRSFCPHRYLSVRRRGNFYVLENLLTNVKRFYVDPRDIASIVGDASKPIEAA